jgi:hypothetical protein
MVYPLTVNSLEDGLLMVEPLFRDLVWAEVDRIGGTLLRKLLTTFQILSGFQGLVKSCLARRT